MSEGTFSHIAAQFVNANKRKSFYNVQSSFRIYNLQSIRVFRICFVFCDSVLPNVFFRQLLDLSM